MLEDIAGVAVRFFRPPFGARRPVVLRIARELGLTPVMWNVTGYDWDPIGADGILGKAGGGDGAEPRRGCASNLLLHDGGHRGMGANAHGYGARGGSAADGARGDGTRFVTVDAWVLPDGPTARGAVTS